MVKNVNLLTKRTNFNIYTTAPGNHGRPRFVEFMSASNSLGDTRDGALLAGAAVADLTPPGSIFLYGYPHVERMSTGVHDALESAALYLRGRKGGALFVSNDIIFFDRDFAAGVRRRISARTGVAKEAIMITCSHTHSGPVTVNALSSSGDPIVPRRNEAYLGLAADRIVEAACAAVKAAKPAEIGLSLARVEGVGTNRHDPAGPSDPEVPVLVARATGDRSPIACMIVFAMHPTVLHEDSKLISADFPYFARRLLQGGALPASCPVIYHTGAAGNQSPRHVTRANTFAEAQRLGEKLGSAVAAAIPGISYRPDAGIAWRHKFIDLEMRKFPAVDEAAAALGEARARFGRLKREDAPRPELRTAECDVFGAEETADLAWAAIDGRLQAAARSCLPAEIQVIEVGPWKFVGWPGEHFVEFALEVKARSPGTFVVTLANGELQGYIVTAEAAAKGFYESTNAVFAPSNGERFVRETLALLGRAS
jgi:neutral ceramidase